MTFDLQFRAVTEYFIEFIDVHKSFGDRKVLDGISFGVQRGETFAILGPSGTGKSVTLSHVVGLLRPDSGKIFVAGQDITDLDEQKLAFVRRKVQLVFQSGALFDSLDVWDNVAFPLMDTGLHEDDVRWRVEQKLRLVEIENLAHLMPSQLSTGTKRAVAIARALAAEPDAILYDEPTTMVDPLMSQTINELILKMQDKLGITQMVVTHDIANCAEKVADRVALLSDGKFAFIGTLPDLFRCEDPVVREFVEEDRLRVTKKQAMVEPGAERAFQKATDLP